jgi:hypothetical protein
MEPEIKANDKTEARRVVLQETGKIAVGEAVCVAVMVAVFALLGRYSLQVLLGGIAGGILAILNFFFMAVAASQAMDKAVQQDVKGGQKQIKLNYSLRMIVLFVILFALVKSGACNALASVLPLFFVRITITVAEFFRK